MQLNWQHKIATNSFKSSAWHMSEGQFNCLAAKICELSSSSWVLLSNLGNDKACVKLQKK